MTQPAGSAAAAYRERIAKYNPLQARDRAGRWAALGAAAVGAVKGALPGAFVGGSLGGVGGAIVDELTADPRADWKSQLKWTARGALAGAAIGALGGASTGGRTGYWMATGGRELNGLRPSRKEIRNTLLGQGRWLNRERLINQHTKGGTVYADVAGNDHSVAIGPQHIAPRQSEYTTFHNHPRSASPPSSADIGTGAHFGGRHVVYTASGSVYHHSPRINAKLMGPKDARAYQDLLDTVQSGAGEAAMEQEVRDHGVTGATARRFVEMGTRMFGRQGVSGNTLLAGMHGAHLALRDAGLTDYRFRHSAADKAALQRYAGLTRKVYEATRDRLKAHADVPRWKAALSIPSAYQPRPPVKPAKPAKPPPKFPYWRESIARPMSAVIRFGGSQ